MVMNLTLSLYPTKRSENRAHIWLFEKLAKKEKQKQKQKQKQNSNGLLIGPKCTPHKGVTYLPGYLRLPDIETTML